MNNTKYNAPKASTSEPLHELVARIDLPALVASVVGAGTISGGRHQFRCPFHDDHRPSLDVSEHQGRWRWRCWPCNRWGDALDFVRAVDGLDMVDGIRRLRDIDRTPPAPYEPATASTSRASRPTPAATTPPVDTTPRLAADHAARVMHRYCNARGWHDDVATLYGLEVVQHSAQLWVRHPFHTINGTGAGWQDRNMAAAGHPRWLAPRGWALPLWNLPALTTAHTVPVVICEGPADGITASWALTLAAGGLDPAAVAVAVPGTASWRQSYAGLFTDRPVVLAFDPDEPGDALAATVAADLEGIAAGIVPAPRDALPDDLSTMCRHKGANYVAAVLHSSLDALGVV